MTRADEMRLIATPVIEERKKITNFEQAKKERAREERAKVIKAMAEEDYLKFLNVVRGAADQGLLKIQVHPFGHDDKRNGHRDKTIALPKRRYEGFTDEQQTYTRALSNRFQSDGFETVCTVTNSLCYTSYCYVTVIWE